MSSKSTLVACALAVLTITWSAASPAEPAPAIKRTVLQKHELRAQGLEGVMAQVEIPPGGREGRHTHPAEVFGYVVEGTITLEVEGRPPATLKAGESIFIEAGKVHEGINRSDAPVKLVAVFVTEKGKPMTTQAQ